LSYTTEHGCAGVDVKSVTRKRVNRRRPPPLLTRVINGGRIGKIGRSGRQLNGFRIEAPPMAHPFTRMNCLGG
jgi:hypothetical protein